MASRKDQKEKLRREREEREKAAKAAERRRRLIGYGAAGGVVAIAVVVVLVLLVAGGDAGGGGDSGSVLPDGGSVPDQEVTDLAAAAKAAGCKLESVRAKSREHTGDLAEAISYDTKPPTSGKHYEIPKDDGAYESAPDQKELVHSMEHGRVIIWFRKSLPEGDRADLKALYDEDPYQIIVTPDNTGMTYAVAATAWNADPQPNGTGRLLGCSKVTPEMYDALRTFKDEHRSNGPENVP